MIKCLRALSPAMAAEHGTTGDLFLAAPGELLSVPVHACGEANNPHCQCRRTFVGLSTGNPTTLARISVCSAAEIGRECELSGAVVHRTEEEMGGKGVQLYEPEGLAFAIRHFLPGTIVRVDRTEKEILLQDTWHLAAHHDGSAWV